MKMVQVPWCPNFVGERDREPIERKAIWLKWPRDRSDNLFQHVLDRVEDTGKSVKYLHVK